MEFAADVRTDLSVTVVRFSAVLHNPEGVENVAECSGCYPSARSGREAVSNCIVRAVALSR